MPPTAWPTSATVWPTAAPAAVTVAAALGATGCSAWPAAAVVLLTVWPAACVVPATAWPAVAVTVAGDGVAGGADGVEGVEGGAGAEPAPLGAVAAGALGADAASSLVRGAAVVSLEAVGVLAPVLGAAAPLVGFAEPFGLAEPPSCDAAVWRCGAAPCAGAAWRAASTGTAGSVDTLAAAASAPTAAVRVLATVLTPPESWASSVAATPSCARMPGQPWKAIPAETIARMIPPAAMIEPEAPAAAAKARKKRIRGTHRRERSGPKGQWPDYP